MEGLCDTRDRVALVGLAVDAARERAHSLRLLAIGCGGYLRDQARRNSEALRRGEALVAAHCGARADNASDALTRP